MRVSAVVLPVGAGLLGDLEGLEGLGVEQMGPEAHVDILALLEEAELGLVGQIVHVLELVVLAALGHELLGLLAGQHEGLEGQVLLDDLLHFLLDGLEVLGRELPVAQIDVVVEAVLGGRAEGEVRLREQALDGLGHDVGRGVAQNVQFFLFRALGHMAVFVNDLHGSILQLYYYQIKKHPQPFGQGCIANTRFHLGISLIFVRNGDTRGGISSARLGSGGADRICGAACSRGLPSLNTPSIRFLRQRL